MKNNNNKTPYRRFAQRYNFAQDPPNHTFFTLCVYFINEDS